MRSVEPGKMGQLSLARFAPSRHVQHPRAARAAGERHVALLRRGITATHLDGVTALHVALILGMQFEGIKGRRAMVFFVDGLDVTTESTAADVRELAPRAAAHRAGELVGRPRERWSLTMPRDLRFSKKQRSSKVIRFLLVTVRSPLPAPARIDESDGVRREQFSRRNAHRHVGRSVRCELTAIEQPSAVSVPFMAG